MSSRVFLSSVAGVLTFISLTPSLSFGSPGSGTSGGGDIQCDNLIQNLSFQDPKYNLESWLQNDGPEKQSPQLDLSSTLNPDTGKPYTAAEYEKAMIALIEIFKKAPDINCVRPGDKGYPVDVNDTSKICKTLVDAKGVHMTCDRELFMKLSSDEQIEQNHHEFAINIPGLEPDAGSVSTYKISTQLSASIGTAIEHRLMVKPADPSDTKSLDTLPSGTVITFNNGLDLDANVPSEVITPNSSLNCMVQIYGDHDQEVILSGPVTFTFTGFWPTLSSTSVTLNGKWSKNDEDDGRGLGFLICHSDRETIGDLRNALASISASLSIPQPVQK